ncbi:hypothetical protein CAMM_02670 [Corynebacterium ammoniagenes DSM 20306]|nr:hypothetical protein CAMM_02670 [Corynebacterium ammoniagenes DSM 20306]
MQRRLANRDQRGLRRNTHLACTNDAGDHGAVNIAVMKRRGFIWGDEIRPRLELRKLLVFGNPRINDGDFYALPRGQPMQAGAVVLLFRRKRRTLCSANCYRACGILRLRNWLCQRQSHRHSHHTCYQGAKANEQPAH